MTPTRHGSLHFFRFAGIDVYVHWSWFVVAVILLGSGANRFRQYSSLLWNVLEYLAIFGLVLVHEFGHALACRQVGGRADQIVLWPLGGVAYVQPPARPGPVLWSVAAGPLVNVVLAPVLLLAVVGAGYLGWAAALPDVYKLLVTVAWINVIMLIFNLLPVYPLDGGQVLRALLWFLVGRAQSLLATTIIGFVGIGVLLLAAVMLHSIWWAILTGFIILNCWQGLRQARILLRLEAAPRRDDAHCPACGAPPPVGEFWLCAGCHQKFDTFATHSVCPHCGAQHWLALCVDCGQWHPHTFWLPPPAGPPPVPADPPLAPPPVPLLPPPMPPAVPPPVPPSVPPPVPPPPAPPGGSEPTPGK